MFYLKNLPVWERLLRAGIGIALLIGGLSGLMGMPRGYWLAGAGLVAMLTALVGFCPLCALAGRRLDRERKRHG